MPAGKSPSTAARRSSRPAAVAAVLAAALLAAGCQAKPCRDGTVLVTVVAPQAVQFDAYDVEVTTASGTRGGRVPSPAGAREGTIEVSFPGGFPAGQRVVITVKAVTSAGVVVASSGATIPAASAECDSVRVVFDGLSPLPAADGPGGDGWSASAGDGGRDEGAPVFDPLKPSDAGSSAQASGGGDAGPDQATLVPDGSAGASPDAAATPDAGAAPDAVVADGPVAPDVASVAPDAVEAAPDVVDVAPDAPDTAPLGPPPDMGVPDAPAPRLDAACGLGTHACPAGCASDRSPDSCGGRCAPCPVPANALAATCDGVMCGVTCRPGFHLCGTACVSNLDPATCGASCEACAPPEGGTATCDGQSCGAACPDTQKPCLGKCVSDGAECVGKCESGKHDCSGVCVLDSSTGSCGSSCQPCRFPAHADPTCDGTSCGFTCRDSYNKCGDRCAASNDVTACGPSCSPCPPPPPNAIATCNGISCGFACDATYNKCNGKCAASSDITACGPACSPCPPPPANAFATCNGVSCDFECQAPYNKCAGACVAPTDIAACGPSCQVCPPPPALGTTVCNRASCDFTCPATRNKCGSKCAAADDITACGPSCQECSAPANGTAVCDGVSCDFTCPSTHNKCNGKCAASSDITACGPSCSPCPAPPMFGTAVCNGVSCGFTCDAQHGKCGSVCVDHKRDSDNCGSCGFECGPGNTCSNGVCGCNEDLFTCDICRANWIRAWPHEPAPCPGTDGSPDGWFKVVNDVTLNGPGGGLFPGPALAIHPKAMDDGKMSGTFPSVTVGLGWRLRTKIGCAAATPNCNFKYQITFTGSDGFARGLAVGDLTPTSPVVDVDFDLNRVGVGESVKFSFFVIVNNPYSAEDTVYYVNPRIVRP